MRPVGLSCPTNKDKVGNQLGGHHFRRPLAGGGVGSATRQNFLDDLSNSVRPFDYIVKAGQSARPKTKED